MPTGISVLLLEYPAKITGQKKQGGEKLLLGGMVASTVTLTGSYHYCYPNAIIIANHLPAQVQSF
jgi:hypothetical protein